MPERPASALTHPHPETAQNTQIKLSAKTAQYRNQISTLLGVSPRKFQTTSNWEGQRPRWPQPPKSSYLKNSTITSVNFHSSKGPSPEDPPSITATRPSGEISTVPNIWVCPRFERQTILAPFWKNDFLVCAPPAGVIAVARESPTKFRLETRISIPHLRHKLKFFKIRQSIYRRGNGY